MSFQMIFCVGFGKIKAEIHRRYADEFSKFKIEITVDFQLDLGEFLAGNYIDFQMDLCVEFGKISAENHVDCRLNLRKIEIGIYVYFEMDFVKIKVGIFVEVCADLDIIEAAGTHVDFQMIFGRIEAEIMRCYITAVQMPRTLEVQQLCHHKKAS